MNGKPLSDFDFQDSVPQRPCAATNTTPPELVARIARDPRLLEQPSVFDERRGLDGR
jgi:hypothetical protein